MSEKFDVHLYAVVRIKVANVTADSMSEAIDKAADSVNIHALVDKHHDCKTTKECAVAYIEYGEETPCSVVDVVGDEEFIKTRHFHYDGGDWKPGAYPRVLVLVKGGVADCVADAGVDVEIFDFDNFRAGDTHLAVPAHFADLALPIDVPVLLGQPS